jgi:hypothetical protein
VRGFAFDCDSVRPKLDDRPAWPVRRRLMAGQSSCRKMAVKTRRGALHRDIRPDVRSEKIGTSIDGAILSKVSEHERSERP